MTSVIAFGISITGDAVAWYGAVVATASVIVAGYAVWQNRTRLKVWATPNMKLTESWGNYSKENTYITIHAANLGRDSIELQELPWFTIKGKRKPGLMIKGPWQPTDKVAPGACSTMLANQDSLSLDVEKLGRIVVRDAAGRKWAGKIRGER